METITFVIATVGLGVVILTGVWVYLNEGGLSGFESAVEAELVVQLWGANVIPACRFGDIERDIPNLREVIIVAHRVEDPQEQLREAVEDNFQEGVCYSFLVSSSQFQSSEGVYKEFFRAIYTIARQLSPKSGKKAAIRALAFDQIFSIRALRGEWGTWPYVFYRYHDDNGSNEKVAAFRGDQMKEGIAENYIRLSAEDSQSIFNACAMAVGDAAVADRLESIGADTQFEDAAAVIILEDRRRVG